MQILLVFSKALWAMKLFPGFKRGSGLGVAFVFVLVGISVVVAVVVAVVVVVVVVVVPVDRRGTMALETEIDLAVLEVAVDAREMGRLSGVMNSGFLGW